MKKILTIAIIIILLLPGSAFHSTLLVMLLVWLWRKNVRRSFSRWWRKGYRTLWRVLSCISLILMPRPFALPTDRSRLVYYNDYGQRMTPPVTHWLINLLLPEETLCSLGCALPESALRDMLRPGGLPSQNHNHYRKRWGRFPAHTAGMTSHWSRHSPESYRRH